MPFGERERDLLRRRRARLAHVVAADRDRVPPGDPLAAVGEHVRDDPHRRLRRIDVRAARGVLLQQVVLDRAAEPSARDALLLGHQLVQQQQDRRRRVDRHRRRDASSGISANNRRMSSIESIATPVLPDLALGARMVGVVAPSASGGRTPPRARSGRDPAGSGTGDSSRPRCPSRRTGASSTAARGTSSGTTPRVNGNSPGIPELRRDGSNPTRSSGPYDRAAARSPSRCAAVRRSWRLSLAAGVGRSARGPGAARDRTPPHPPTPPVPDRTDYSWQIAPTYIRPPTPHPLPTPNPSPYTTPSILPPSAARASRPALHARRCSTGSTSRVLSRWRLRAGARLPDRRTQRRRHRRAARSSIAARRVFELGSGFGYSATGSPERSGADGELHLHRRRSRERGEGRGLPLPRRRVGAASRSTSATRSPSLGRSRASSTSSTTTSTSRVSRRLACRARPRSCRRPVLVRQRAVVRPRPRATTSIALGAILEHNGLIADDDRYVSTIVPTRDGVMVALRIALSPAPRHRTAARPRAGVDSARPLAGSASIAQPCRPTIRREGSHVATRASKTKSDYGPCTRATPGNTPGSAPRHRRRDHPLPLHPRRGHGA